MSEIAANLAAVRARIAAAAQRVGRDPAAIALVAVTKRVGPQRVVEAIKAGQRLFGENYLQEAGEKMERVAELLPAAVPSAPPVAWHFIGHLQSNKALAAADRFAMVETVDRLKTAAALNRGAAAAGLILPILVQVNVGGEAQKSGVAPAAAAELLGELRRLPALEVRGLMTMPPWVEDPEAGRPYFRALRQLAEQLRAGGLFAPDAPPLLSMGMSADFEVAVEEGADLVRVGSALFGPREAAT